jgi:hypothetical protein
MRAPAVGTVAGEGVVETLGFPLTRFPDGAEPPGWFISQGEEGGLLERHGVTRASASNGARHPVRFTFHKYRPRDLNAHWTGSEPVASALG